MATDTVMFTPVVNVHVDRETGAISATIDFDESLDSLLVKDESGRVVGNDYDAAFDQPTHPIVQTACDFLDSEALQARVHEAFQPEAS